VLKGGITTNDPNMLLLIGTVIGNIATMAGGVAAYWFGTSKSSSDKNKIIQGQQ
jgi:hypothetical protein